MIGFSDSNNCLLGYGRQGRSFTGRIDNRFTLYLKVWLVPLVNALWVEACRLKILIVLMFNILSLFLVAVLLLIVLAHSFIVWLLLLLCTNCLSIFYRTARAYLLCVLRYLCLLVRFLPQESLVLCHMPGYLPVTLWSHTGLSPLNMS